MKNRFVRASGFTLIELIIAMAIMAILVSLILPSFRGSTSKAKITDRTTAVKSIHQLIDLEVSFNQELPPSKDAVLTILSNNNALIRDDFDCGIYYVPAGNSSLDFIVATAGIQDDGNDGGSWIYQTTNSERFDLQDASSSCDNGPDVGGADAIRLN